MDEKTFTLSREDRDFLFEVLATDRTSTAGLLGSASRRLNEEGRTSWNLMVQEMLAQRWERTSRLMALFAEETEE